MKAMQRMGRSPPRPTPARSSATSAARSLIVEGSLDPDWADPRAEGEAIVAAMPAGIGRLEMIEGAGHYPHTQFPDETVSLLLPFLKAYARA